MGCWNGTCAVSNLPILYKDPVTLLLLTNRNRKMEMGGGFCYPNEFWEIRHVPIYGIYDDYGCIEKIEDQAYHSYICKVESGFEPRNESRLKYLLEKEEIENVDEINDLTKFINLVERGHVPDVSFMMVHRDIFDHFANIEISRRMKKNQILLEKLRKYGPAYAENVFFLLNPWGDNISRTIMKYLNVSWTEGDLEDPYLEEISKVSCFQYSLEGLRKMISPQSGAGSQHHGYEEFRELMNLMEKRIQKVMEGWEE